MSVISKCGQRVVLVCAAIFLVMTLSTSQAASTGIRMCNPGFPPCPDDMFCDDKTYLCYPCDADVCNKEAENWEDACKRNCPKHYAKILLATTPALAAAAVPELDVAANQLEDSLGQAIPSEAKERDLSPSSRKTLNIYIGVLAAGVVTAISALLIGLLGLLAYRSRQRTQNRPRENTEEVNLRPGRSMRDLPVTSEVNERRALEEGASVGEAHPEFGVAHERSDTDKRLLETAL